MYLLNFTASAQTFNTTPGCLSIQLDGTMNFNSGITYLGNIFVYDKTYTSSTVNNGDIFAGGTVDCVLNQSNATATPLKGCTSSNLPWNNLQALAANKIIYSPIDNATTFGCPALPIRLTSFDAIQTSNGNKLNWTTSEEVNAQIFNIERSLDGINFEKVGTVNAAGNTSTYSTYNFFDRGVTPEIVYYRLKEIDMDGTSMYSSVVVLRTQNDEIAFLLSNPVKEEIKIQLLSEEENMVSLINSQGGTVFEKSYKGSQLVSVRSQFAPGVYFVRVSNQSQISYLKTVIE